MRIKSKLLPSLVMTCSRPIAMNIEVLTYIKTGDPHFLKSDVRLSLDYYS